MYIFYNEYDTVKEEDMEDYAIIKDIESLFHSSKYIRAFKYLDMLKERNIPVDFVNDMKQSIPILILELKQSDEVKCEVLKQLLRKYQLDLNRTIIDGGNILLNSLKYIRDKDWYQILINHGADINSINSSDYPPYSILDKLLETIDKEELFIFLRKKGAKTWREICYKELHDNGVVSEGEVSESNSWESN